MKKHLIYILLFLICVHSCSLSDNKRFCIDYPKPVECYKVGSLGKTSIFTKGDSIILFMKHYLSAKESKVLSNVYAYIDIDQKKMVRIDSFDIDHVEKTNSLEDKYSISTNDPNIPTIQTSYENWGRGGKQNSKIALLNKDQKIIKETLFPCFKNSAIKLLFATNDYVIIEASNIYNENDHSTWLYIYKISDITSNSCNAYLSESIDFNEKIPDSILNKFDATLIGEVEF